MSSIPLKYVEDALWEIDSGRKSFVQTGKERSVSFAYSDRTKELAVAHYGTTILCIEWKKRACEVGGWSATDRDIINSVFAYYRLPLKVSVAGGWMHFAGTKAQVCDF